MSEPRWQIVELPERVRDDELPRSRFYVADEGVIVIEVLGGHDTAYQIVKRLNQWELAEHERHRREMLDLGRFDEMGG